MIKRLGLIILGITIGSQAAYAMTERVYTNVMDAVNARDLKTLKRLRRSGVDFNTPQPNGMTPLCETIRQGDYEGYEMLMTQGASPYAECVRQIPLEQVRDFYANQPKTGTYYTGHLDQARTKGAWGDTVGSGFQLPTLGAGEILLGGAAVAGIVALGHGSISSGGGGGGGGGGDKDYVWTAPLNLKPATFETAEYKASSFGSESIDVLGPVNASSAYARGYTGYWIKRKDNGELIGEKEAAIDKTKRVKVAVVDEGVWVSHPDLKDNIGSNYNYVYGVCSSTNTIRCWQYDTENEVARLYENWSTPTQKEIGLIDMSKTEWLIYATRYKNYEYNSSDAAPNLYYAWRHVNDKGLIPMYYERYEDGNNLYLYDSEARTSHKILCNDDGTDCWYEENPSNHVRSVIQYDNHGTHVAGLVGATKNDKGMMGVAYNAQIIPIKMDLDMDILEGITAGVETSDIVNLSIQRGMTTDGKHYESTAKMVSEFDKMVNETRYLMEGYRKAAALNKILVFAAGNYTSGKEEGDTPFDPSLFAVAPLSDLFNGKLTHPDQKTYNLQNLFVNVVSVTGAKNTLAPYSAKCGATKDFCIAAPGGLTAVPGASRIFSTVRKDVKGTEEDYGYDGDAGTSMAAPIVSGALAVIKGAFPHLTNQQVVQILFETATDLGEKGVDETYGHGLVNLEAATSPVGLPKISLNTKATGEKVEATKSSSTIPAAFSGVASALPAEMIILDKYDRAFAVPTKAFVRVAKRENKLDGRFKSFMRGDEKVVVANDQVKMAYSERRSDLHSDVIHGAMSLEVRPTTAWRFKTFYTENTETTGGSYFSRLMQTPYAKMKEAWGGSVSYNLTKNWQATLLGQIGRNGYVDEKDLSHMDHNKASVFQSSLQYNGLQKVGLKVTAGVSNEQGSTLGMWGRGAFKSGDSRTSFVGAGVTLNLTDTLTIEGMYYSGVTKVQNNNSLVKMSNLKSDSFAVTAAWKMNEDRVLGLQFVSPLRVRRGTATVDLPVARDAYADVVYRDTTRASLKPTAREYDIGLYYKDALKENVHLQSEFGVRLNPDHVAGATPDWRALVGLSFGM